MKLAASTYMFWKEKLSFSKLSLIKEAGFSSIEVFCLKEHFDWQDLAGISELKRHTSDLGIEIHSFHAPYNEQGSHDISSPDTETRKYAVQSALAAMETLVRLGGSSFVVHPAMSSAGMGRRRALVENSVESLEKLCAGAEKLGVRILLENTPPPVLGSDPASFKEFIERMSASRLGACLDTGHAFLSAGAMRPYLFKGLKLFEIHLSDNMGSGDDGLIPGEGKVDWIEFRESLRAVLAHSLEETAFILELEEFPGVQAMKKAKAWLEQLLGKGESG